MARFVVMDGHQKDLCCEEVGPCAQYIVIVLVKSSMNISKRACVIGLRGNKLFTRLISY